VATEPDGYGDVSDLLCPRCGYIYLHHGQVIVFDRGEDAAFNLVTTIDTGTTTRILPNDANNPSSRRQGMTIAFICEGCGDGIELTIAQHKGCTQIGWRFAPLPEAGQ
jgi:hypothetical protein